VIGYRHLLPVLVFAAWQLATGLPAVGQQIEESDTQVWVQYEYQHRIKEKLRGSWDLGYRELVSTEDILGDWSRVHMRGAFELRTWQGAIVFWPMTTLVGRELDLRHRFRLEQRWIDQKGTGETDFSWRFRYRLATFIPLNKRVIEDKAWYLPLMGEAFSDLGSDTSEFFAARLRLTAGLGYVFSKNWTLEFRYTAQKSRDTVTDSFATNDHILDLRIRTAVRIRDLHRQ
jgi:hypothetical protein